jgi:PEP-CTERM motif
MKLSWVVVAATLDLSLAGGFADASVVIDIYQSGANVVASGSGRIDLTDLTAGATSFSEVGVVADEGIVAIGAPAEETNYSSVIGPASFGSGGTELASTGSGDLFGVASIEGVIGVPENYVSGSTLFGSVTFDNATIASLGLTPGTYVYTWGSGAHADSLTVDIVPEPSTWVMMLIGFAGLGFAGYRTSRKAVSIAA